MFYLQNNTRTGNENFVIDYVDCRCLPGMEPKSRQWQCEVCDMVTDNSSRCRGGVELLGADSAAPPPVVCSVADAAP